MPYEVTKPRSRKTLRDANRDCLQLAVEDVRIIESLLSIIYVAKLYSLSKTTLYHWLNGRQDQLSHGVLKQGLTSEEEKSLEN